MVCGGWCDPTGPGVQVAVLHRRKIAAHAWANMQAGRVTAVRVGGGGHEAVWNEVTTCRHTSRKALSLCWCEHSAHRSFWTDQFVNTHQAKHKHESFRLPLSSPKRVVLVLRNAIQAVKNQILLLFYFWLWHCCSVLLQCYRTMRHPLSCSPAPRIPCSSLSLYHQKTVAGYSRSLHA